MRKSLLLSCLLLAFSIPAFAQPKAGQYTGPKPCKAKAGAVEVDVSSSKTIGVANCKLQIQKALEDKKVCDGKKKGDKISYDWQFGKDDDKDKATGTADYRCK